MLPKLGLECSHFAQSGDHGNRYPDPARRWFWAGRTRGMKGAPVASRDFAVRPEPHVATLGIAHPAQVADCLAGLAAQHTAAPHMVELGCGPGTLTLELAACGVKRSRSIRVRR